MKIETLYKKWITEQKYVVKENTYNFYEFISIRHILPFFKEYKLKEIDNNLIRNFINMKLVDGRLDGNGGLSKGTVKEINTILLLLINYGFKTGKIPYFKVGELRLNDKQNTKYEVFNKDEITMLCNYLKQYNTPKNTGILLAIYTGIRIGELSALKYENIINNSLIVNKTLQRIYSTNTKTKIVITEPKSKKANRIIPINKKLEITQGNSEHYILTNATKYIEPRTIREYYKKVLLELNIPYRPFHYLRHTFATRLINNTGDYKVVSELLGHSSVSITLDIYMHSDMNSKVKCINSF